MRFLRGSLSLALFACFGVGGLLLSLLVLPFVRSRKRGLACVVALWRILVRGFQVTGLTRAVCENPRPVKGSVIVANHPSLIDVVFLTVLLPNTISVAKRELRRNPFIGRIVRQIFLSDGETFLEEGKALLAEGYNVLIFPEGTRSPADGGLHPFKRGAAHLALQAGAPLLPVFIRPTRRLLGKGQPIWDMGRERVLFRIRLDEPIPPGTVVAADSPSAARLLTERLEKRFAFVIRH
ncbi:MAG: 1-acyl-sn-glycerol-3-phosphate acyltransferase [Kiritimatiellae bacterium]|nr:1-acyl-sn-glycerol-3-phosphate acyltransferase [Kiritimatiellia bacterium]